MSSPPFLPVFPGSAATTDEHRPFPEILEYAAGLLLGHASMFTERALVRIRSEAYCQQPARVPDDLDHSAHMAGELAVAAIAEADQFSESARYAWEVGTKRAEEGVPLGTMLQAYRIGGEELWNALVDAVVRGAPHQAHLMVRAANDVWRFSDRDTGLMTEAHRRVTGDAAEHRARRVARSLNVLLAGRPDTMDLSRAAIALDLPLDGRFAVARLVGSGLARPDGTPAREELDGMTVYWCQQADGWAVMAELGERPAGALADALRLRSGQRGGLSAAVVGLGELMRARELAEVALSTCNGDGRIARLEDRLAAGFVRSHPDLARELLDTVLGRVLALGGGDGPVLMDTLDVWLDCDGNAGRAADRLYCHRNTVFNRLRRLERMTERRLDRPRDLVELSLALEAHRLSEAT